MIVLRNIHVLFQKREKYDQNESHDIKKGKRNAMSIRKHFATIFYTMREASMYLEAQGQNCRGTLEKHANTDSEEHM